MSDYPQGQNAQLGSAQQAERLLTNPTQIVFLFVSLILIAASFGMLSVFIKGMVHSEYEELRERAVQELVSDLNHIQFSTQALADMLSSSGRPLENAGSYVEHPNLFKRIVWYSQNENGQWVAMPLSDRPENKQIKHPPFDDLALLQLVLDQGQGSLNTNQLHVVLHDQTTHSSDTQNTWTSMPIVGNSAILSNSTHLSGQDFILAQPVLAENGAQGILVTLTNFSYLLTAEWLKKHPRISHVALRDFYAGKQIYMLDRRTDWREAPKDAEHSYEFPVGDAQWELTIGMMKSTKTLLLEAVPLFIVIFGGILTGIGFLYLRGHQRRAVQLTGMYQALERKNIALEVEAEERERLDNALQQAERENNALIDSVSDIIFETDTNGDILFLNARWEKVTGFTPARSIGQNLLSMLHKDDQQSQKEDFRLFVKGQKQAYRTLTSLRTADGSFRAVDLALSMIRQDEGKTLRVVGTITDVEKRRRAERALKEAEKKYRNIVENAAGGIYQITPEGLYLSANRAAAQILGYGTPEDILHDIKNAHEEIYLDPRARAEFIRDLEQKGTAQNFETRVRKKDGREIWINENARVVRDDAGNTLYYEGAMEDITQRTEAEIALRAAKIKSDMANRAKSEFLSNMSHELRTPLNAIIGFSELIKDETFGAIAQSQYKDYATDIHQSGKALLDIINEILDISKIEAGQRALNEEEVDIQNVVDGCVELLNNKIEEGKLTLDHDLKNIPAIIGEELALKQIIMNLLSNAVKFTPEDGRVTISYERDQEGDLRLCVSDTGIGLDEEEIAKALSPFGQVDNSLARDGSGTGLGLTLVDALIKLHGGELELFSQKGIGTTVTVTIPKSRIQVG